MIKGFCVILILSAFFSFAQAGEKKCLLVMSYHNGYEWNDGIERGVVDTLAGICQLKKIYLNTKRNPSERFGKLAALRAKQIIDEFQPDVLIASDDNASRYLIKPYYRDVALPVVFCGLNWTAEEYGYPYKNATGMVEVAPIIPLLINIQRSIGFVTHGVFLSSNVLSETKDYLRYKKEYGERGVSLKSMLVSTMSEWKNAFIDAQNGDFIVLGNNAGINDWDAEQAQKIVMKFGHELTVTNYQWMMPYAMFGVAKSAKEQGVWAAEVSKAILNGLAVDKIPVTINKTWNLFVNEALLKKSNISLSNRLLNRAEKAW